MNIEKPAPTRVKTRNLSALQYLDALQTEYLIAELRKKISPLRSDREYYLQVMERKKVRIEDISVKNHLLNIFNSDMTKKALYLKFYPKFGIPLFDGMKSKDISNYFFRGSNVRVDCSNEIKFGIITDNRDVLFNSKVKVLLNNEEVEKEFSITSVSRIL